jgi:hypothetical protein
VYFRAAGHFQLEEKENATSHIPYIHLNIWHESVILDGSVKSIKLQRLSPVQISV